MDTNSYTCFRSFEMWLLIQWAFGSVVGESVVLGFNKTQEKTCLSQWFRLCTFVDKATRCVKATRLFLEVFGTIFLISVFLISTDNILQIAKTVTFSWFCQLTLISLLTLPTSFRNKSDAARKELKLNENKLFLKC